MLNKTDSVWIVIMVAALIAAGTGAVAQKTTPPRKTPDALVLAEDEVKQLVLLMDTDRNGRISKQEYMKFMEAEFDRLDVNHNGELDVNELKRSRLRASRSAVGK